MFTYACFTYLSGEYSDVSYTHSISSMSRWLIKRIITPKIKN